MKTFLGILAAAFTAVSTFAQGTFQFSVILNGANEVPPNSSLNSGNGQFTLNDSLLSWSVGLPDLSFTPIGANVYGPASTSQTAPSIFSLGTPTTGPGPQGGTLTLYSDSITLTAPQISDLQSGLWYVNILSDAFPAGEIRGQITAVPEPSTLGLFGIAGAVLVGNALRRRRNSLALIATGVFLTAGLSAANAQGVIESGNTTGPVAVAPGGTPDGQFVAPWIDVPPTMPYVDRLPVYQEPTRPPFPDASVDSGISTVPEPSAIALLCVGVGLLTLRLRKARFS